jgi:chromosome segregation ATPase
VAKKYIVIAFAVGLALGILGTAGAVLFTGGSGGAGGLAELDRANQQRTAEAVDGLGRKIEEQRERITELEQSNSSLRASNRRLEKHIGDARRISAELAVSVGTTASDIRSAVELLKKITDQVKSLDGILSRGDTGGHSGNGLDNLEDL